MGGGYTVAQTTAITAPLIVAALCLYAHHRQIGGRFLLYWAAAHLALSLTFAIAARAPRHPDLGDLPLEWLLAMTALLSCNGAILLGVLELEKPRIRLAHGLPAVVMVAAAMTAIASQSAVFLVYVMLPAGALAFAAAGILLLIRRRSLPYVVAGLVMVARSVNGLVFIEAAHSSGTFEIPGHMSPLAVFFNFLTGLSLLMIAVDDAWRRLGEVLEATRREKAVADAILDLAPVSILQKDRDLRVVHANRNAHEICKRLTPQHASVVGLRSAQMTPDAGFERAEALDHQLLAAPESGPLEYEDSYGLADGGRMTMLVRKAALADDTGEAFGTITVSLDVTHLKRTEERLRELFERAERANQEKSDFLANMSHELRTPLNGIGGFAEMLAAGGAGPLTGRQREYVEHILTSSRAMQGLVSDILDLSRIDSGRLTLTRQPLAVGDVLQQIAAAVAPKAAEAGVTLTVDAPAALVVDADRRALLQALANLVDNAVRYNRPGGRVWITAGRRERATVVVVRDTGLGMTPEQVAASGDPFLRGDALKARYGGGAGLGLAVARGLIELHGGRLAIDSRLDEGTTVSVEL